METAKHGPIKTDSPKSFHLVSYYLFTGTIFLLGAEEIKASRENRRFLRKINTFLVLCSLLNLCNSL